MQQTLTLESQSIATELGALIKQLDSARWREELASIQERLNLLSHRIRHALQNIEIPESDALLLSLQERLTALGKYVEEYIPEVDQAKDQLKQEWTAYKQRLIHAYEAIADNLKLQDIHVPSLRPTNYKRNLFHALNGIMVLGLIQHTFSWSNLKWVAAGFFVWAWSMEYFRKDHPQLNRLLMGALGSFAHPHENYRVNSGTWFITALFLLALFSNPTISMIAVIILGFGDPSAALIGRRWGRIPLFAGRTLEGTLAFVVAGSLTAGIAMAIYTPWSLPVISLIAIASAVPAALAELFSKRVDDNLTIPLAAGLGATLTCLLLNIPL